MLLHDNSTTRAATKLLRNNTHRWDVNIVVDVVVVVVVVVVIVVVVRSSNGSFDFGDFGVSFIAPVAGR